MPAKSRRGRSPVPTLALDAHRPAFRSRGRWWSGPGLARHGGRSFIRLVVILCAVGLAMVASGVVHGNVALTQLSTDPYSNSTSAHQTEVEPDTFAFGSTIVSAFQAGRFFDGGASNIGWATSRDGGKTWTRGFLPAITRFASSPGPYDRVSDPAVAYDARHGIWMISSLALHDSPSVIGAAVVTSRSSDGGLTWDAPVTVSAFGDLDKNWIACDSTATSPYYGNCYTEFDDAGDGDRVYMVTSRDGGLTWGPATRTANQAMGLGGQPVVQPSGTVVVPLLNPSETAIIAFRSTDGGVTWSSATTASTVSDHRVAGGLRTSPLPSAEIDAAGKVYVAWQDCRFRPKCKANDIVMTTSIDGTAWTPVVRIPTDDVASRADHFIPGLAVDPTTSGNSARLALAYYYYPKRRCAATATTDMPACKLNVGFISSSDGGATWSTAGRLAGPMALTSLPPTSLGVMVGDYISTSYSSGTAHPVFPVAKATTSGAFDEAMHSPAASLVAVAGTSPATAEGAANEPTLHGMANHVHR